VVNLELSPAYDPEAHRLLHEAGLQERAERRLHDIAVDPAGIEPADVVVLHRVVCCYPDYERLLASADARPGSCELLDAARWPGGRSGGWRLTEAKAHALVVSAEAEPPEARFLRAGVVGLSSEPADGSDGGVDVSDREKDVDAAFRVLVVEPAADRRSLDPRLVTTSHRVKGPCKQLAVEGLRTFGVRDADLEEGWFAAHGCSRRGRDVVGTDTR
jgi:hypothetical protein